MEKIKSQPIVSLFVSSLTVNKIEKTRLLEYLTHEVFYSWVLRNAEFNVSAIKPKVMKMLVLYPIYYKTTIRPTLLYSWNVGHLRSIVRRWM